MKDIAQQITQDFKRYTESVANNVKSEIAVLAKETLEKIRSTAPRRTGKYRKNMALDTAFENKWDKRVTWYVKGKQYRLTHLLIKDHPKRNGGRVTGNPFIADAEEWLEREQPKRIEQAIEKVEV